MNLEQLIKTYGKTKNGRPAKITNSEWKALPEDIWIEHWKFKAGSMFKAFETTNFGWLVFAPDTKLANGAKPIKRIFKW